MLQLFLLIRARISTETTGATGRRSRAARWPGGTALVVLDEIHKWRAWKGWLKGEYDRHRDRLRFLVTGSARLDVYRRGGDSLQGRYHHYRLHPFTLAEVAGKSAVSPAEPGAELAVPGVLTSWVGVNALDPARPAEWLDAPT